jgi:hypothetical protein
LFNAAPLASSRFDKESATYKSRLQDRMDQYLDIEQFNHHIKDEDAPLYRNKRTVGKRLHQ